MRRKVNAGMKGEASGHQIQATSAGGRGKESQLFLVDSGYKTQIIQIQTFKTAFIISN